MEKRLALFIPHTDTTLETDLQRRLAGRWILHTCRMQLDEVGEEAERRMVDEALPAALDAMNEITSFDAAVFGCTSASAVYGAEGVERLHRRMEEALGCPVMSAFGGLLCGLEKLGWPKAALLTPYTSEVNEFLCNTMREFGIDVAFKAGLGLESDPEIAKVAPRQIVAMAQKYRENIRASAGVLILSCTNLRAVEAQAAVEGAVGLPVLCSNGALLDWIEALST